MNIPAMKKQHDIFVILPEHRVAWCLTPKVASTAIAQCISEHYEAKLERPYHETSVFNWFTLAQVQEFVPDYRRIMFVRNPFDRLVGCYEYHIVKSKLQMSANMRALGFRAGMLFDEFLFQVFKNIEGDAHFAMQAWQCDKVDFLGKFENIDEDWNKIYKHLGFKLPSLRLVNKTDRKPYQEYYTDDLRKRVERVYDVDLDLFGYKFEE